MMLADPQRQRLLYQIDSQEIKIRLRRVRYRITTSWPPF